MQDRCEEFNSLTVHWFSIHKIEVYGVCGVVVAAWLFVKQKVGVRFPSDTLERMLVGITSFFGKERTSQRLLVSQFTAR